MLTFLTFPDATFPSFPLQEGRLRQLLRYGLHSTAQQVMSAALQPASHSVPSGAAMQQPPGMTARPAAAGGGDLPPTPQPLQAQPDCSSAEAIGQPPQQPQPQAQMSGAQHQPQQAQQASAEPTQAAHVQQAQQAQQTDAEPQQARQGLFHLLMHAARSAAGTDAGLTPELAASFMMLMHRLPPGEREEKVRCIILHTLTACKVCCAH